MDRFWNENGKTHFFFEGKKQMLVFFRGGVRHSNILFIDWLKSAPRDQK